MAEKNKSLQYLREAKCSSALAIRKARYKTILHNIMYYSVKKEFRIRLEIHIFHYY